jgi:hypothetical protein
MTIKGVNFHLPTRGQFSTAVDSQRQKRTITWSEVHAVIRRCMRSSSGRWFEKGESYSCIGVRTAPHTPTCGIYQVSYAMIELGGCWRVVRIDSSTRTVGAAEDAAVLALLGDSAR